MFPELMCAYRKDQGGIETIYYNSFDQYGTPAENYPEAVDVFYQQLQMLQMPQSPKGRYRVYYDQPGNPNMARFVFNDYFLMLGRHVVNDLYQAALEYEGQSEAHFNRYIAGMEAGGVDSMPDFKRSNCVTCFLDKRRFSAGFGPPIATRRRRELGWISDCSSRCTSGANAMGIRWP